MKHLEIITFTLLIIFSYESVDYSSLYGNSDINKCISSGTSSCKSVSLSKNMECCIINANYYGGYLDGYDFTMCSPNSKYKMTDDDIKASQQIYREAMGFTSTMIDYSSSYLNSFSFKINFDCPSQSFTIDYNIGSFTDEEKEVFKDERYCLRLYYQGLSALDLFDASILNLEEKTIQKSDCNNAVLLPSTKDIATCAYASFNFKLINGTIKPFSTCLYISKSSFNTKNLDQHLESSFEAYDYIDGVTIESYEIEITDKNNNKLKYDSLTNTLSKGELLGFTKILSILLMIYLL